MEPLKKINDVVTPLPRGGYLVDSGAGYIQFGAPPETIKDTMLLPKGAPLLYVLPGEFFNWIKGISIAELEFPIYYNFFIRDKKTRIICYREQGERFLKVLRESLFGPEVPDFSKDFETAPYDPVNIKKEMDYFRYMSFDDVVEFCFYENNSCDIDGITVAIDTNGDFAVQQDSRTIAQIPGRIEYMPKYLIGERLTEPYEPPLFGMTCLGPSHGFDPHENTSGFILWLNHSGIMIDPPVNSTEWLLDSNVNPKFIDSIILTHCHADHDAGTFQKILEEGKVTIYTTRSILMSFLRKYSALTNTSVEYLMSLFEFHPVMIGAPLFIHGARFDMFYTLHSIPAIGFRMEFQDRSLTYSSDHNNEAGLHNHLFNEGIISKERFEDLRNFPWDSTVVFHDAGSPPLHSKISYLNELPEEIKKKIMIYHIAKNEVPENTDLVLAQFGIENTVYFDVSPPPFEKTYQVLGLLKYLDFFHEISITKAQEFISIVKEEKFAKGDTIIKSATIGDKFFIIYSGNVSVHSDDGRYSKIMGAYDYFGEMSLVTGEMRSATVVAENDVVLFAIEKDKFLNFIVGTEYEKSLRQLARVRDNEAWEILSMSSFLSFFTSTQRTWLEAMLIPVEFKGSGTLIEEGKPVRRLFIIRKGEVIVSREKENRAIMMKGDLVGPVLDVFESRDSAFSFEYHEPVSLYEIEVSRFLGLLRENPGLVMKFHYVFTEYLFL